MGLIIFLLICIIIAVTFRSLEQRGGDGDIYDMISMEAIPLDSKKFIEPANETEFRKIFEDLANKLYGYKISVSQAKCPDLLLYDKILKKTVRAELEYMASDFFKHKHKWDAVDLIICWHNDIEKSDIPIIECKDKITEHCKNGAGVN